MQPVQNIWSWRIDSLGVPRTFEETLREGQDGLMKHPKPRPHHDPTPDKEIFQMPFRLVNHCGLPKFASDWCACAVLFQSLFYSAQYCSIYIAPWLACRGYVSKVGPGVSLDVHFCATTIYESTKWWWPTCLMGSSMQDFSLQSCRERSRSPRRKRRTRIRRRQMSDSWIDGHCRNEISRFIHVLAFLPFLSFNIQ